VVALLAASTAGCGAGAVDEPGVTGESPTSVASADPEPSVETLSLQGGLAVAPAHAIAGDDVCMAWGDYTDFNADGQQVVIEDAAGATVGVGEVGAAETFREGCVRWFEVEVPAGGDFYTATVGEWSSEAYPEADLGSVSIVILMDD